MSGRSLFRAVPPVRELLSRATWEDLDRIAARHQMQLAGRRRPLAVERLAATLERPDQLRAAYAILNESARATLRLLMLLGSADDERALIAAGDRLLSALPDLSPGFSGSSVGDLQTLRALGLCFADRRRVVVPVEVLGALPVPLLPTVADAPAIQSRSYAALQFTLEALVAAIEQSPPVAISSQRVVERVTAYQPSLLPPDAAVELGRQIDVVPREVALLLSMLHTLGAVAPLRGRWQVQPEWNTLRERSPRDLLAGLLDAWEQPRVLSDLVRSREFVWMCASDSEVAEVIAAREADLRALVWRWLRWAGPAAIDLKRFSRMLSALHAPLFQFADTDPMWIAPQRARNSSTEAVELEAVARAIVRELVEQLSVLGLLAADSTICRLSPAAAWLLDETPPSVGPAIRSADATSLIVNPLQADPAILQQIARAGRLLPPEDEHARYELSAQGLTRLLAEEIGIDDFERALLATGAELAQDFRAQLGAWAERAGRLKLHQPLTVIVTAEDAPLAQILAAAGVSDRTEIIGAGCALIEPEHADAALEQLRARGFWPRVIGGRGDD